MTWFLWEIPKLNAVFVDVRTIYTQGMFIQQGFALFKQVVFSVKKLSLCYEIVG
jgi:hypothetical protein